MGKALKSKNGDEPGGPVTQSNGVSSHDNWVHDLEAANCEVTNVRRLDRYPIEQLLMQPCGSKWLLFVDVQVDEKHIQTKAEKVNDLQHFPTWTIAGRRYYQLRCSFDDTLANEAQLREDPSSNDTEKRFMSDFFGGKSFIVQFNRTVYQQYFAWKNVVKHSSTVMFFGPPLDVSRLFDSIFHSVGLAMAMAKILQYHRKSEGGANTHLCLYNVFLFRQVAIMVLKCRDSKRETAVIKKADLLGVFWCTKESYLLSRIVTNN